MKFRLLPAVLTLALAVQTAFSQSSASFSGDEDTYTYQGSMFDANPLSNQTEIQIKAKQLAGEKLLLAYYYFGQIYVKDSITVDAKGKGKFVSKEKLPQGLYTICVKRTPVFDLILGGDQTMTVKIDTTNHYDNIVVEGSAESADFNDYAMFMKHLQRNSKEQNERIKELTDTAEISKIKAELRLMGASMTEKQNILIKKYPQSMCGIFVKGLQSAEFKEPEGYEQMSDSMKWVLGYAFQRDHYFDNINLSDERSLHTPYLSQTLDTYMDKVLIQRYDSIIPPALALVEKSRGNENTFRAICNYMLQRSVKSNIMGMDRLLVDLGKKYYLTGTATWADSTLKSNIGKEIKKIEHSLVGDTAHNIKLQELNGNYRPIYDMSGSQYTVLFFFEPQCGHCKKTAPQVAELYEAYKDDPRVKVIAVYMLTDKKEWTDFIEEKKMQNMTNVWDPERTSFYWYWYDTSSTPMIYVLDKDHKIFAKKIDADTLKLIFEHELK